LDSGIDYNHPDIDQDRIKERKSWIGGDPDVDVIGHGTHIASTILQLTRNVDLYIAKVTKSRTFSERVQVAEVMNLPSPSRAYVDVF
jgi:subtilisin family serine protease